MRLYLEFVDGPDRGKKLSLEQSASVGRTHADILINDPKLSGTHAYFKFEEAEGWLIIDGESRNGVWVNGIKEVRKVIKDGDLVQMGATQLQCRLFGSKKVQLSPEFQKWVDTLLNSFKNRKCPKVEVKPELRLRVIQGVQHGEIWDVFYGPRKAGRESLDICLYDDAAPRESFEVLVKGSYPYFYTENEKVVKLNDQSVKHKQLEPGDVISFGETQILIEFNEGDGFSS